MAVHVQRHGCGCVTDAPRDVEDRRAAGQQQRRVRVPEVVEADVASLDRQITRAAHRVADLDSQAAFRRRWLAEHPDLARRVEHVQRELQRLDDPRRAELLERLDALGGRDTTAATSTLEYDGNIVGVRDRLDQLQRARRAEPPVSPCDGTSGSPLSLRPTLLPRSLTLTTTTVRRCRWPRDSEV